MSKKLFVLLILILFVASTVMAHGENHTHVRLAHFAADAPNVNIYVDGEAALENFAAGSISPFLELEPGSHTLAVVLAGESMEDAVIGPTDIELIAGHYHTVAVVGQAADDSLAPMLIDETAEMEGVDMSQGVFRIIIHNINGAPRISYYEGGQFLEKNIPYGGYSADLFPAYSWDTGMAVAEENLEEIIFDFDSEADSSGGYWEPYTVYLYGMMGNYPGAMFEDYTIAGGDHYITAPDLLTFLSAFSNFELTADYQTYYRFDKAVSALETSGIMNLLAEGGPYTLFIPTDAAFETLPEDILNDPEALRNILLYHVVEGSLTYDDLVEAGRVKTLQGAEIQVSPSEDEGFTFRLNENAVVTNFDYPFLNGTRIWFVDNKVLMP